MIPWYEKDNTHRFDGTRVRIKAAQSCYKKYDIVGNLGTVINWLSFDGKAAIQIDDKFNNSASKGYFYMKKSNIEFLEEETMAKIENYLNIAVIRFLDERNNNYYKYANFIPELKENDVVAVMSANHGMGLAKVVDIVDQNDLALEREIVSIVDTADYDARVAQRKLAADLKAKMQERAKKLQDVALYQMLAKDDPEMAALLSEYQNLV